MDVEQVMDFLVDHRAPGVVPGYVSEQLLSMSWIIDAAHGPHRPGGESVAAVRRPVPRGRSDRENETYLADSWEEIAGLAAPLKERFPSMAADVDAWMARAEPSYERLRRGSFFEQAADGS